MIPTGLPNQFLNWKLVPKWNEKKQVNVDTKVPCDPSGNAINAHDPSVWLTQEQAAQSEYGMAFAFDENDPWFFLDLDKCKPNGQWSAEASAIFQSFNGAWGEVSQSGSGLHIMGRCNKSQLLDRRNKWDGWLEFYIKERFIAFGDQGWSVIGGGEPTTVDWTNQLRTLVPEREFLGELADGIDPAYTGTDDDDKLIEQMLKSKSTANQFGKGASVADLWNVNKPVLAANYPDFDGDPNEYDGNAVDMALMSHLAFWTGKDRPRMDRLFRLSGLMRDKYDNRADYRKSTVEKACRLTTKVYDLIPKADRPKSADNPINREVFLSTTEMIDYFKGCVYVRDAHRMFVPDGAMLKPEQFNAVYGGHWFQMLPDNTKPAKKAFEAFTETTCHRFPKVVETCFRPDLPPSTILDDNTVNIYVDPQMPMVEGDISPVMDLLFKQLPNEQDRNILINYLAAVVQYPGVKFQWCPVLQGCEGNGKTLWARCVMGAVGKKYSHTPKAEQLGEKYNDYIVDKIFINVEEIWMRGRLEVLNSLKDIITNEDIEVRSMGRDKRMIINVSNWYMCTNHLDGVLKSKNDRRYSIFYTAQQNVEDLTRDGMDGEYFPNLYRWLKTGGYAIVAHWLKNFPIDPTLNPADACHRAPITSSTDLAITASLGGIEQEVIESSESGVVGFKGGWVSSYAMEQMLKLRNVRITKSKQASILQEMGYVSWGRSPRLLTQCDGLSPWLWYKGEEPNPTFEGFMNAQGWRS